MNDLLIKNVTLRDQNRLFQILIQDGKFKKIAPNEEALSFSGNILDAQGGLANAPFCEPHVHLDTTQTAGEPSWNISGTLFEGIERWS